MKVSEAGGARRRSLSYKAEEGGCSLVGVVLAVFAADEEALVSATPEEEQGV